MSAYKDTKQGTWYVSFRYIDWTGKKTQKLKRGFKTKKEALNYEKGPGQAVVGFEPVLRDVRGVLAVVNVDVTGNLFHILYTPIGSVSK